MPQLLPDGINDPAEEEPVQQDPLEYGESWEFHLNPECDCTDPLQQLPHLAVRGNVVQRTEEEKTLEQWIVMALATDRYRWEIYDNQYGTEINGLIGESLPEAEAESAMTASIREAILVDPRVASVTSIQMLTTEDDENPAAFIAEIRVVTYTGELKMLRLDTSLTRTTNAYLYT